MNRIRFVALVLAAAIATAAVSSNNVIAQFSKPVAPAGPAQPSTMPPAEGPASPSKPMPRTDGSPAMLPAEALPIPPAKPTPPAEGKPEEFDPVKLYGEALREISAIHLELRDKKKREAWMSKWKDFQPDEESDDPEGDVDQAITDMLASLGQRFDCYLTAKATQERVHVSNEKGVVISVDLGNGITYVMIRHFSADELLEEVRTAFLSARKRKGLILDLRNNPGGLLDSVLTVACYFLEDATLMVRHKRKGDLLVEDHIAAQRMCMVTYRPQKNNEVGFELSGKRPTLFIPPEMPVVVLVNEESASGSELLARLLQYYRRATIVGVPTCGKDTGLQPVDLPFGRRLYVTNSRILPAGQKLDGFGVIPDKEIVQPKDHPDDLQLQTARQLVSRLVQDQQQQERRRAEVQKERLAQSQPSKSP